MLQMLQAVNLKVITQLPLMPSTVESSFKNNEEPQTVNAKSGAREYREAKWGTGLQSQQIYKTAQAIIRKLGNLRKQNSSSAILF